MTYAVLCKPLPDLNLPATGNQTIRLWDFRGRNILLYFYHKDDTRSSILESKLFRNSYRKFVELDTVVFGISRDSIKLHEKFKAKQDLPFPLLSDKSGRICKFFNVLKEKAIYGKIVSYIEGSTFLIDKEGFLIHQWRDVNLKGHISNLLNVIAKKGKKKDKVMPKNYMFLPMRRHLH
jgi:thioredoxin-dependent peroxiredoxin